MHEVCNSCYQKITTELILQKPPKSFVERLEKQTPMVQNMPAAVALDPETKALEERLNKLRVQVPLPSASDPTSDDLLRQMNDELAIEQSIDQSLAERLRILHETMPAATPNTVVLPSAKKIEEDEKDDEEFPWCTVCNDNANRRCLDCDELFCEPCSKKIHRQSGYKRHEIETYRPSTKAKKKYAY